MKFGYLTILGAVSATTYDSSIQIQGDVGGIERDWQEF